MNIILFTEEEIDKGIPSTDKKAKHISNILKLSVGDSFSAGIINDAVGKAEITQMDELFKFNFTPLKEAEMMSPITLICGLPRPPVAKRILKDSVTAGVKKIFFITVENSEKSYAQSKLWTTNEHKEAMIEGAQQGVTTFLPEVKIFQSVSHLMKKEELKGDKIFLDNITGSAPLADHLFQSEDIVETVIAVGAERGWTDRERRLFISNRFQACRLGRRILRTETAVTAAISMAIGIKQL